MTEKAITPMFVIDSAPVIKWPVTVHLPVDGGETASFQFTGIFNRMSESELDELLGVDAPAQPIPLPKIVPDDGSGELVAGEFVTATPPAKRVSEVLADNAELFPRVLVGWEQVKTTSGNIVPFDVDVLKAQVTGPNGLFLSGGLWRAITEIRNGARLGN